MTEAAAGPGQEDPKAAEKAALVEALRRANGDVRTAAELLGAKYKTVLRRMHEFGIPVRPRGGNNRKTLRLKDSGG